MKCRIMHVARRVLPVTYTRSLVKCYIISIISVNSRCVDTRIANVVLENHINAECSTGVSTYLITSNSYTFVAILHVIGRF